MKLYIAGPMTGYPELNFPAFHAAAKALRARGHEVVSPAEVNPDPGMAWGDALRRDIPELLKCEGIALLPGWRGSRGALVEQFLADVLGMPTYSLAEALELIP